MTRMLTLAAPALACALSSPAFATASITYGPDGGSGAHGLVVALSTIGALVFAAILCIFIFLRMSGRVFAGLLGLATLLGFIVLAVSPSAGFAAEVVAPVPVAPAVILPWGDWVVAIGQTLTSVLLPVLVALIGKAVYQVAPWARLVLTQARLEQMTKAITDYALNATEGVVKGQALTIPVGSAVIAKAVQRAVDAAPAQVVKAAGGPNGVAELVFRTLHLQDGATAANTLAPAQAAIVAK